MLGGGGDGGRLGRLTSPDDACQLVTAFKVKLLLLLPLLLPLLLLILVQSVLPAGHISVLLSAIKTFDLFKWYFLQRQTFIINISVGHYHHHHRHRHRIGTEEEREKEWGHIHSQFGKKEEKLVSGSWVPVWLGYY